MPRILITGSARGIGLALVRHYLHQGAEVIAVCRDPGNDLPALACEIIAGVELTESAGIESVCAALGQRPLDVLIHNAGVMRRDRLGILSSSQADFLTQFAVNSVAPLLLTEALLANLFSGAKIALISSRMGSIADNGSGGSYGYRMSKAALNIAGKSLSIDLRPRGIAVALLHPGFVRTAMTSDKGDTDPAIAAESLARRIEDLNLDNSGSFWHARGEILPW